MIITSHCWLGMSYRINGHARTRQIVYYRIRASWTFVYIIKPSSPSAYGVYLRLRRFLKLRGNLPFYFVFRGFSLTALSHPLAAAACSHVHFHSKQPPTISYTLARAWRKTHRGLKRISKMRTAKKCATVRPGKSLHHGTCQMEYGGPENRLGMPTWHAKPIIIYKYAYRNKFNFLATTTADGQKSFTQAFVK